jgi:hypothetical protein
VPIKPVKKTVYKKRHPKTVKTTVTAPCTTPGHDYPPPSYYDKRDANADADADADADAKTEPEVEANYWRRYRTCRRKGIPRWAKKYSCEDLKRACRKYVKPKTKTVS